MQLYTDIPQMILRDGSARDSRQSIKAFRNSGDSQEFALNFGVFNFVMTTD